MNWRLDNRRVVLVMLALVALLMQVALDHTRTPTKQRDFSLKLSAAELAARAFEAVRDERGLKNAKLDLTNDPAGTGLIGPEVSPITNASGNLEAKLTSLNPNFAAVFVQYFRRAGLKPGTPVAVGISGSFPGMNICLYAALEVMDLKPVVITSVGASNWGANNPDFTWLDMESLFIRRGIFHTRSQAATFGGGNDMGRGLSPHGRRLIRTAIERNNVPLLASKNLEEAISKRMVFYEAASRGRLYRLYVNVGGGVASLGSGHNKTILNAGLSFDLGAHNWARKGTLILFSEKGAPVVHILKITDLATRHGLPVAPDVTPEPGEGNIFVRTLYRWPLAAAFLLIYGLLCLSFLMPSIRQRFFARWRNRRPAAGVASCLLFAGLAVAPAGAQAGEKWTQVAPLSAVNEVCLRNQDQEFVYLETDATTPLEFSVTGPRRVKIISRFVPADTTSDRFVFDINLRLDGAKVLHKTFAPLMNRNLTTCIGGERVSSLRRAYVDVPWGVHLLQLSGHSQRKGRIVSRLFRRQRRATATTVPFAPEEYRELATLQFESGNQSTYYRFDGDHPLSFSVTGPTNLQVYTRLDFGGGMLGRQQYTLEVWRDNVLWRTFHYDVKRLANGFYPEELDLLPGTRKKLHLRVPRGDHHFVIRPVTPGAFGVTAQIRIPQKDLASDP